MTQKDSHKANKIIYTRLDAKGIKSCELRFPGCNNLFLAAAHRKKRRHYRTVEELSDFRESILSCQKCHTILDDRSKTSEEENEAIFRRLRA